jgi:hypothetical protein
MHSLRSRCARRRQQLSATADPGHRRIAARREPDILTRMVAQKLTESFGQQVIVDNRSGAGGIIGTETCGTFDARRLYLDRGIHRFVCGEPEPACQARL